MSNLEDLQGAPLDALVRRAILTAGHDLDRLSEQEDCVPLLKGAGRDDAARALSLVLRLRGGVPAEEAGEGGDPIDLAVGELRALFALEPELPGLPDRAQALAEDAGPAAGGAPPSDQPPFMFTLSTWLEDLTGALREPPSGPAVRTTGELLARLRQEVLEQGSPDLQDASPDPGVLGFRLALASLRRFLVANYHAAYGPVGSPALFHRLARARAPGLGAYGRHAADLVRGARETLALLQLARGRPLCEWTPALSRWSLVLLQATSGRLRIELVDELADLGLTSVLWGQLASVLREPDRRPDRELLQHVRDAGLDLQDLELAWRAQALIARWWSDDKNEWLAQGDIAIYRRDYAQAEALFERALRLAPDDGHGQRRLQALREGRGDEVASIGGFGTPDARKQLRAERLRGEAPPADVSDEAAALDLGRTAEALIPELAPDPRGRAPGRPHDGLHLRRVGARRERSRWGELAALGGVEAIRGFLVSTSPAVELEIRLGGRSLARTVPAGFPLEAPDEGRRKYVFNAWIDVSGFAPGRYELDVALTDLEQRRHVHREHVLVVEPRAEAAHPHSDAVVDPPGAPGGPPLETDVNSRPSRVRPARRTPLEGPLREVLVLRVDQLGDMVCSIPAVRRLRQVVGGARVTGLVSPANAELARSLGLFDEVIVADFPTDPVERRRVMPLEAQAALRAELHARDFDLAIDFADHSPSRYLLLLSGARRLVGMANAAYRFLDLDLQAHSRDQVNGSEVVPASNKALALVEGLAASMKPLGETVRRQDLDPGRLARFEVEEGRYAVLHTGARLKFSRWPHYAALATALLERTALGVVAVADDPDMAAAFPPSLRAHPRFQLVEGRLPFDDLDALLSYCAVFVGNDSGPKHLASLRGSEVVSLHCARNNWNEWGQENRGVILSRRVPCAGCQIESHAEECGKAIACLTHIAPEEVLQATLTLLDGSAGGRRTDT